MGQTRGVDLSVRPARQRRSRESWNRVLDAGVAVLTERGSDGFTIAAVCERAGVAPPTIYRRTPSKDALFLAVYEHGIEQIRATEAALAGGHTDDEGAPTADRTVASVGEAVAVVAAVFAAHRDFLRAVILISATNDTVRGRGVDASHALADLFARLTAPFAPPGTDGRRDAVFQMVFGSLVLRTGFGADFAAPRPVDEETYVAELARAAEAAWTD